jgi:hypothetical protein
MNHEFTFITTGAIMKFWRLAGLFTGLLVVSWMVKRSKSVQPVLARNPDTRYTIDEFIGDQNL